MSMHYETAATGNAATQDKAAGEYLTFVLGNEEYGIEILKVQEIRGYDNVTKFKLGKVEYDEFTVVIILNLNGRVVGIVVDGVSDVTALQESQVRDVPDLVSSIDTRYILGLASVDEHMLILVDIERLMKSEEMALMDGMAVN